MSTQGPNEHDVRVSDPGLSRETNEALTDDLRDAVGADRVSLPGDAAPPRPSAGGRRSPLAAHRLTLGIAFLVLTTVGAVVAVTAGSWWYLVGAWAVHALGTMLVAGGALSRLTEVERTSERTRELMERDGVADPDARFNELVAHFGAASEAGAAEVVAPGHNERTVLPEDDPGRAAVEQRTAMTPSSEPTEAVGTGSPIGLLALWLVAGMMVVSLVVPVATGIGAMWVLPAVVLPIGIGWLALQWRMGGDEANVGRAKRVPAVIPLVVVGVAVFAVLMIVLGTR